MSSTTALRIEGSTKLHRGRLLDHVYLDDAAFVYDPDGNNIEAVHHGPHDRPAPSVEISFDWP